MQPKLDWHNLSVEFWELENMRDKMFDAVEKNQGYDVVML
jgi:hypothetical protein